MDGFDNKPLECPNCGTTSTDTGRTQMHPRINETAKVFSCPNCEEDLYVLMNKKVPSEKH
jgi:predicted RNA-binding Zn-ribbon protein involved in translation (DUF1610 family)